MFTKNQLIFAGCFVVCFLLAMIWSYRKDIKRHNIYYKNTAIKVLIWIVISVAVFSAIRIYSKS